MKSERHPISASFLRGGLVMMALALVLAGCATLPSSGPTGSQVTKDLKTADASSRFKLVELTTLADVPPAPARPAVFSRDYAPPPTDLIGNGDVLDIAIYEAGVTLFGGSAASAATGTMSGFDPSAKVERMLPNRVDDTGMIRLPYAGTIRAAGRTTAELATVIKRALRGMSQDPQIVVAIREGITNSVIIGGDVNRPGRLVLPTNRETISDAIALAGGYRGEMKDMTVRVFRREIDTEFRLSDVLTGPEQDMRVYPGDRISLVRKPRTFSVMGAANRIDLFPFGNPSITLAEAIATAGGSNPGVGDAKAIFVFRFERGDDKSDVPVVYHLNMMKGGAYFLSQRFNMQDKDVLYFGNAQANQPTKLIQLISQLFAPIVTVGSVVN